MQRTCTSRRSLSLGESLFFRWYIFYDCAVTQLPNWKKMISKGYQITIHHQNRNRSRLSVEFPHVAKTLWIWWKKGSKFVNKSIDETFWKLLSFLGSNSISANGNWHFSRIHHRPTDRTAPNSVFEAVFLTSSYGRNSHCTRGIWIRWIKANGRFLTPAYVLKLMKVWSRWSNHC